MELRHVLWGFIEPISFRREVCEGIPSTRMISYASL
jgi:hypothetical protein